MIPGDMPVSLDTQTNPMRGDWNQYSSSVYSEGFLDKKGKGLVVDEVTVKVEGDAPLTWNADETHLGEGQSQGNTSDFLDYRESLEPNPNIATHSPLHTLRDRDPVSTSMAPSDSHGRILFDQVLNSNDRARVQALEGGATSGGSKEKRFFCMFCNKGFNCPQKVEIHQRVHVGVKPFSCTQCHMRFSQAWNLKIHQRVHTGEKPYSCSQCHMRFAQTCNLKRHQRGVLSNISSITDLGGFDPVWLFLVVGGVMFILGFAGCIGALRENSFLLKFFSVFLGIIFFLELTAGVLAFVFKDWIKDQLNFFINNNIRAYRDDIDLQNLIDFTQEYWECCGAFGADDWNLNIYFNCTDSNPSREKCGVPFSCCTKDPAEDVINTQCGYDIRAKADSEQRTFIYIKGCVPQFEKWLQDNLTVVAGIFIGIALLQIFGICLAQNLVSDIEAVRESCLFT
ncbi:tetraspanin-5 [Coregonus clupeaformis]|nr:tetraspanin-5 [Coregonus clupeaformis]